MTETSLSIGTRKQKIRFKCITSDELPLRLSGNVAELGDWVLAESIAMDAYALPQGGYEWTAQAELPLGQTVEYKFVKQYEDGPHWESGNNHRITVIPGLHTLDSDFQE
ncbi:MAG TPA: carbohydrate-binding module family 20 domain-containing protein [Tepidisphaeraceae bacterium]|jgi:hypothetical protein|nr:carbohydrate-binding module family 20 domain-containing protein [Tepidisphaeraceae bacterium]